MNKQIERTIISLAVLTGAYACGEGLQKDETSINSSGAGGAAGLGGTNNTGGSNAGGLGGLSGTGGADCIENNPGSGFEGAATSYYGVTGNTAEEAGSDIFDPQTGKGFKDPKTGKIYAAQASCDVEYTFDYEGKTYFKIENDRKVCCWDFWVTECDAPYEAAVTLPRWGGCDYCWDQFLEGLVKHEQGHVDLCKAYSEKLEELIQGATASECADDCETAKLAATNNLVDKVEELAMAAKSEFDQKQDDYDNQTNHGETQGAVLDPDCKE